KSFSCILTCSWEHNERNESCRTLKTLIMFSTSLYTTKITEVVLSLRILDNFLPILRKRRLSCMTNNHHSEALISY
ncbi:hypothetical protein L9F63_000325, partial [Diploptera punctata]